MTFKIQIVAKNYLDTTSSSIWIKCCSSGNDDICNTTLFFNITQNEKLSAFNKIDFSTKKLTYKISAVFFSCFIKHSY